jgi:hypothetical protein
MRTQHGIGRGLLVLSVGLAVNALLGPLAIGVLQYHFGAVVIIHGIGLDAVTLLLIAPVAALAGILTLHGRPAGPVLGLGPAAFAVYLVRPYVIGPAYDRVAGNAEHFLPFHLALFVLAAGVFVMAWAATLAAAVRVSRRGPRTDAGIGRGRDIRHAGQVSSPDRDRLQR